MSFRESRASSLFLFFCWGGGGGGERERERERERRGTSSQKLLYFNKCINYFKTHIKIIILLPGFCPQTKVVHKPIKPTQPTRGIWLDPKLKINQTSDYDGQWRVHHTNSSSRSSGGFPPSKFDLPNSTNKGSQIW